VDDDLGGACVRGISVRLEGVRTFTHDCGVVVVLMDVGWFEGQSRRNSFACGVGCFGASPTARLARCRLQGYRYRVTDMSCNITILEHELCCEIFVVFRG
jgi:hypothetical protein